MAKENDSSTQSEAAAILEFLPDEAAVLNQGVKSVADEDPEVVVDSEEGDPDPAQVETEDPEVSEDDESQDSEKPVGSEKVQKRIDKLTARAKTAEEEAEQAKARVKELEDEAAQLREAAPQTVMAPTAENPLADVDSAEALEARVANAVAVKRWCIKNPDGGTVTDKEGNEVDIDPEQARSMLADAEDVITVHAPRRERFLAESVKHTAAAKEVYPDMFKSGTEMEKAFQSLVKAWPEVKRFPDHHLVLGDYIAGFKARSGKAAPAQEPAAKAKPSIAPPVPRVAAPKPKVNARASAAGQVLETGGSLDSLTEFFAG